ncbi:MAG: hypothetical protein GY757_27345 [bacterium]|nr:hypothetical protein [bacterium]
MSESNGLDGGWTPYSCDISPEAQKVFDTALDGLKGVEYTPVAVATQVVAGVNYSYFCNAKVVYPNPLNKAAMVKIFKPLGDDPPYIRTISEPPR